jgi:excisionase family DNA binding protein
MKLLTVAEVADLLSVSESLVYRLKDEGKLRSYRIGKGAIRFLGEDVTEYVENCAIEVKLERRKTPSSRIVLKNLKV